MESIDAVDLAGRQISTGSWKNQIVIINVWATWCAPCRRELPALEKLHARYRHQVRVIGVLQDNVSDDFARQFVKQAGLSFPIVRSSEEIERRLPAILVIPMTFVIDRAGRLVSMFAGEADAAALEKEIKRLSSTVPVPSTP